MSKIASQGWVKDLIKKAFKLERESYPMYDTYSIDEIVIGEWIDGKPLYRKVFEINQTIDGWTNLSLIISDIDRAIDTRGLTENCAVVMTEVGIRSSDKGINVYTHQSYNIKYLIIEYTKTTDAPNSFTPSLIKK